MRSKTLAFATAMAAAIGALLMVCLEAQAQTASLTAADGAQTDTNAPRRSNPHVSI